MKKNFLLAIFALLFMTWSCSDTKDKKSKDDDTEETGKKKKTTIDGEDIDTESDSGSDPADVVKMIFKAAKSGDYSALSDICAPDADGDANDICGIADASEEKQDEFKSYFAKGKVVGDAEVEGSQAKVNIKFGPDGDQEETMMMMKKGKKWKLVSF